MNHDNSQTTSNATSHWLDQVRFDDRGLVTAIAQDHLSGKVLMVAWMNREALQLTADKGVAVYFSRSRNKLWHKGEESGHTQLVKHIRLDCDGDVILLSVEQQHGIACHTGREACFFYELDAQQHWQVVEPILKNPEDIYRHTA